MLFRLNRPVAEPLALLKALKQHDMLARIEVDAARGTIDVQGRIDTRQALAVLGSLGFEASVLAGERAPHVRGGSTCCGHCA